MRNFRRLGALLLTALMVISTNTTAFAAETENVFAENSSVPQEVILDYEFDITPDMVGDDGSVMIPLSNTAINQTFNMTSAHTGSTRTYIGNHIEYGVTISGASGNLLALQYYHSSGTKISEQQFWCNGEYHHGYIPITSGNSYFIKYLLAYGTPTTITVHMQLRGVYI